MSKPKAIYMTFFKESVPDCDGRTDRWHQLSVPVTLKRARALADIVGTFGVTESCVVKIVDHQRDGSNGSK